MLTKRNSAATLRSVIGSMSFASLALLLTLGAGSALTATSASAMPLGAARAPVVAGDLLLVRDGCGRGMRWSNRRERCVEDDSHSRRDSRGSREECPRGWRYSERFERCVPRL